MVLRRARSRPAGGALAAGLGAALLVAVSVAIAAPAWSIVPPVDPDPAPGAAFAITSTVPAVTTSSLLTVSGVSGAGEEVTVEAVGAGNATCVTTASGAGAWSCLLPVTEQSAVTIQAYREGGLFVEDYDERTSVTVFAPAFDSPAGLVWGASDYQQITGTRYSFNEIHVMVDGVEGTCAIDTPAGGPTLWSCTMGAPLAEGSYTISAYQTSLAFMPPASGATVTMPLTVDLTAPAMATVSYPFPAGPAMPPSIDVITTTDHQPFFEGSAEPGATVTVRYEAGSALNPYWDASVPTYCTAVADGAGQWACAGIGWFASGDVYSFGAEQTDVAGNTTVTPFQQFALSIVAGPVTPVITSPASGFVTSNPELTVTGTGVYGDSISIYRDGEYGVCYTSVGMNGTWSCVTDPIPLGAHAIQAQASSNDSYSAVDEISITVVTPPVVTPPPPPPTPITNKPTATTPPPPAPLEWEYELTDPTGAPLGGDSFTPGTSFIITAGGLPPGSTANAELHSDPIALGSGVVGADGFLNLPVTIPADAPPGEHTLVVILTPPDGVESPAVRPVSVAVAAADEPAVTEAAADPDPEPSSAPTGVVERTSGSGGIDVSQPSTLGATLQSAADVVLTPVNAAVAASAAVAFILLVALPAELLQSTVAANYARAFGWLTPLRRKLGAWKKSLPPALTSGRAGGAISVALTALVLGFSDPGFGFNGTSLRLWVAIFASLYIVNVAVIGIVREVAKRRYGVASSIQPMPASLLIVLASVVLSRLAGIEPGFLFGLVVGIAFGRELLRYEEGRLAALGTALMIGLGVIAWLTYSLLPDGETGGFWLNLVRDTLAATTLESLGTILVSLLPVAYLDGQGLFKWSRWLWAGMYGLGVVTFMFVVVPMSGTWGEMRAPYLGWMGLFAGFAVVAVGIWAAFRFVPERESVGAGKE